MNPIERYISRSSPPLSGVWSNPATWVPGSVNALDVPQAGATVIISAGQTVTLDTSTNNLASLTIAGTLVASQSVNVGITAGNINITSSGRLQIGAEGAPYTYKATIEVNGAEANRVARFVADETARSGSANGRVKDLTQATSTVAETITITFSSASAFSVSGSVSGALGSGTTNTPFSNRVAFTLIPGSTAWSAGNTITLVVEQRGFTNDGVGRSIQVQPGGQLILIGTPPTLVRSKLNANSTAGATAFTLADSSHGWVLGDEIVIGPSDFFDSNAFQGYGSSFPSGNSDKRTINTIAGTALTVASVTAARWGSLQYATGAGPSLTNDGFTTGNCATAAAAMGIPAATFASEINTAISAGLRTVLDERAPVLHLTRNIVIRAPNDTPWASNGFGVHCMFMGKTSVIKLNGVEVTRAGQAGAIGRYPIHWHMMSYEQLNGVNSISTGTYIGAPVGNYIKNSAVHASSQRGTVVHGTWGVLVDNNNYYDIKASCVFLEDQVEQNNTITNNYVLKVRRPNPGNLLLDLDTYLNAGPTGFWFPNPQNTFSGNTAADVAGSGINNAWLSSGPTGLCRNVAVIPKYLTTLYYADNTGHSNYNFGLNTQVSQGNERGQSGNDKWQPSSDGTGADSSTFGRSAVILRNTAWKNVDGGYSNRVLTPTYREFLFADNSGMDAQGVAGNSDIQTAHFLRHTAFGYSLNHSGNFAYNSVVDYGDNPRAAVASYNAGIEQEDCLYTNFPSIKAKVAQFYGGRTLHGGVFRTDDLYITPVEIGSYLMPRLKMINSSMGRVTVSPFYETAPSYDNFISAFYTQATAACTGGTTTTLTATSAAWTTNQWAGKHLIYVVSGVEYAARIVSNTATILTIRSFYDDFSPLPIAPVAGQNYQIREPTGNHWTLHQVMLDPSKMWSQYDRVVHSLPFFTYGATGVYNSTLDRWTTNDLYYGIETAQDAGGDHNENDTSSRFPIDIRRWDATTNEVGAFYCPSGFTSGYVDARTSRYSNGTLTNMRHFTVAKNGRYVVYYPGQTTPASFINYRILDAYRSTDTFLIRLPWNGASVPNVWLTTNISSGNSIPSAGQLADGTAKIASSVASLAACEASSTFVYWRDTGNNWIWIKYWGGLNPSGGSWANSVGGWSQYKKHHHLTIKV
jgi:hypothetical protein